MISLRLRQIVAPALVLGALALGSVAHAQVINYTASTVLTNPTVNGITIQTNNAADNNDNAAGFGTSDTVGGFRVQSAPATSAQYTSGFTTTLVITDVASSMTKTLNTFGTLSVIANSTQVQPGSTNITLNPALYSIDIGNSRYFVQLERFDSVGAQGSQNFGSYSYRFSTVAVPEPGSVALLVGITMTGAGFLSRRRKSANKAA